MNNPWSIIPKLPSRDLKKTAQFYQDHLGFEVCGEYLDYLLLEKNGAELHFFL